MSEITINVPDNLRRRLRKLENPTATLKMAMGRAVELVYDDMTDEPTKDTTAFSQLATLAQKRAYWAKVNSGEAQHGEGGYIRSHRLRDSWRKNVTGNSKRVTGEVFTELPYAKFVQGKHRQPFHARSNWVTDEIEKNKRTDDVTKIITEAIIHGK